MQIQRQVRRSLKTCSGFIGYSKFGCADCILDLSGSSFALLSRRRRASKFPVAYGLQTLGRSIVVSNQCYNCSRCILLRGHLADISFGLCFAFQPLLWFGNSIRGWHFNFFGEKVKSFSTTILGVYRCSSGKVPDSMPFSPASLSETIRSRSARHRSTSFSVAVPLE